MQKTKELDPVGGGGACAASTPLHMPMFIVVDPEIFPRGPMTHEAYGTAWWSSIFLLVLTGVGCPGPLDPLLHSSIEDLSVPLVHALT